MEKLTNKYRTIRKTGQSSAQMIKDKPNSQIVLRIKDNGKLIMDIPFEYLYDMLLDVARKKNNLDIKDPGLLIRLMTMRAGESHTNEILAHIKKEK